ncbi:ArsR/SmtB family transcription factor [Novosphingobium jiangmenense]|uniref:Winged helix-turn-helix transcriptional regulator n=1 Tax=Novosphingobium jiangmenense TaxID=2791981 RepID=A0ABS0HHT0_9SPHN|nr:metalloregulator ArsR/SmtB family transcription factor [Novosphingobium jiangmenense]MBF9151808.1 winged helix-turn-helix transcriptional regulator [Novosphingobium jiangmenense]
MVHYNALDRSFSALADATRRGVIEHLLQEEASVGDLADRFAMTLTGMKKHIAVLEQAGLVTTEKVGRTRRCRLGHLPMAEEAAWIDRYRKVWATRFESLDAVLEMMKREENASDDTI